MKIFHFSDTHLGFSEYNRIDSATGLNQREQDFYHAWWQVIAAILEAKPDVVVHAGDLFHTPRPSNRAIRVALEGIQKISDAGIPLLVISGNHSTPRIHSTGSIFESIALFPGVYTAYSSRYECFRINKVDFHCVPHCSQTDELEKAFQEIKFAADADFNVLVTHGAWTGKQSYTMGEFNEHRLPDIEGQLGVQFDYIALGHYHRHIDVKDHVCYSGSTERTSLNEHGNTCGYLLINLEQFSKEYVQIHTRKMVKMPELDCQGLNATQIYDSLKTLCTDALNDAIVTIKLTNIPHDTLVQLDARIIEIIFASVFHLEKRFEQAYEAGEVTTAGLAIDSLPIEFERYIESLTIENLDKTRLKRMGAEYLEVTSL